MNAIDCKCVEFFPRLFKFGEYQRDYSWKKEQVVTLLKDIEEISLDGENNSYFLGSVIIKEDKDANRRTFYNVIDGQQRLITLSLLFKAFLVSINEIEPEDEIEKEEKETLMENLNSYLFASKMTRIEAGFKDKSEYDAIMHDRKYNGTHLLGKNYKLILNFFKENYNLIEDYQNFFKKLEELRFIQMTTIGEDEYKIFENINTKNLPLKPSDRVKSLFLSKVDVSDKKHYNWLWYEISKDLDSNSLETLLLMFYSYKTKKEAKKCELYERFKKLLETNNIHDLFSNLKDFHKNYLNIKNNIYNIKYDKLKMLINTSFDTDYCILFYMAFLDYVSTSDLSENDCIHIFRLYESYIMRLYFIGMLNRGIRLTTLFDIHKKCLACMEHTNCTYLLALQNIISELMPSNELFILSLKNRKIGLNSRSNSSKTKSIIFTRLENSFESNIFINRNITTEHIMPQVLTDEWKDELGENFEEIHKHYVHKLCNLTVTVNNARLSNKSFEEKKNIYKESNYVFLNQSLTEYDKWNEESMKQREEKIIERALAVWPNN